MTNSQIPVTPDELHAYVDGELPPDRLEAVLAWLAAHPEDAALVAGWRAQADSIRARYGAVANEPVPARLGIDRVLRNGKSWRGVAAAAVVAAFLGGGVAGWMAHGAAAAPAALAPLERLTAEAMAAHKLYINEVRHPIEVGATEAHLVPWLSRRVGTQLRAPDLASFDLKLLGGRLLPGVAGPAALFMYESGNGERLTIYCSKLGEERTPLIFREHGNVASVQWIEGGYAYVVSGPADKARLKNVARATYLQLENRPAPAPHNRSTIERLIARFG
ncbi:MAG: anti-sigma factor [Pseudorhodoplanes sp.]